MKKTALMAAGILLGGTMTTTALLAAEDDISEVAGSGVGFIGLGAAYKPDYEGSDDYEGRIAPFGRYNWASGRYISLAGTAGTETAARVKGNMLRKEGRDGVELGPVLQYRLKRDDDVDNNKVSKMKEVDAATELGAFIGFTSGNWSGDITYATDVSSEHDGSLLYFNGGYRIPVNDKFDMKLGAHVTWADDDYMDTYFGVSGGDSVRSGLKKYTASSGIKDAGVSVTGFYRFNQTWGLAGLLGYTRMLNDAEDSPLVDPVGDENQMKAVVAVTYTF
jgi:outer membrane scaffolding protein for murein synthesis (MipA/OmpV family)